MATVQIKGHLVAYHWDHQEEGEVHWSFSVHHDGKLSGAEVMLIPHTFQAEVPDHVNVVAGMVQSLEEAKKQALKDYQATVAKINERLSKLLAITNEVSA